MNENLSQSCTLCAHPPVLYDNDTNVTKQSLVPILPTLLIAAIIGLILWLLSREKE